MFCIGFVKNEATFIQNDDSSGKSEITPTHLSDQSLQTSTHTLVNFSHPGNVGKSNPRYTGAPAGGPDILHFSTYPALLFVKRQEEYKDSK